MAHQENVTRIILRHQPRRFVGPSRACMTDSHQADVYMALMSPDTVMIYDPGSNALVLLHRPSQIAFFMRGNV